MYILRGPYKKTLIAPLVVYPGARTLPSNFYIFFKVEGNFRIFYFLISFLFLGLLKLNIKGTFINDVTRGDVIFKWALTMFSFYDVKSTRGRARAAGVDLTRVIYLCRGRQGCRVHEAARVDEVFLMYPGLIYPGAGVDNQRQPALAMVGKI